MPSAAHRAEEHSRHRSGAHETGAPANDLQHTKQFTHVEGHLRSPRKNPTTSIPLHIGTHSPTEQTNWVLL